MRKSIRVATIIVTHTALVLAILYLAFFLICTAKAGQAASAIASEEFDADTFDQNDLYLEQAMREHDFSVVTVGRALSEDSDSSRETLFLIVDLILPLLCIASGILIQIAATHPKRKHAAVVRRQALQSTNSRR